MKDKTIKIFNLSLELVHRIQKGFSGDSEGISVKISKKSDKGFGFEAFQQGYDPLEKHKRENVVLNSQELGILNLENLVVTKQTFGSFSGIAAQFCSDAFNEEQSLYFRQVVVLTQKLSFIDYIQDEVFQTSPTSSHRGRLRMSIGGVILEAFAFHDKTIGASQLIIDALEPLCFDAFLQRAYRILMALGFATGKFCQNEGYYLGFDNEEMATPFSWRYQELRDSKNVAYHPVYGNARGIIHDDKVQAEKYYPILRPVPLPVFANLCDQLYQKPDFQAIMVLFLEACSSSLLLMPAGLSVVLEGLRTIIKEENEATFSYLDKKLAKEIKDEMNVVLDKFQGRLSETQRTILERKINDFDKPTNQAQLMKPFELYGIELNDADKSVLKNRNHFLHGRISLGLYERGEDQKAGKEMHYHALKLYTLVSMLVLKYVGYEGWVINHTKVYEHTLGRTIDEPYFIKV